MPVGTIVAALGALDVDASTPEAIRSARVDVDERPWRRLLPATVVMISGTGANLMVHVHHGDPVTVWVELEEGGDRWALPQVDRWVEPRLVDGDLIGEATFWLPAELPDRLPHRARRAPGRRRHAARWSSLRPAWNCPPRCATGRAGGS